MKKKKFFRFISSALAFTLLVSAFTGCSSSPGNSTTSTQASTAGWSESANAAASGGASAALSGEIDVGVSTGLTGSFTADGLKVKQGVQLAQDEINNNGGVLGKSIKFLFEDDQNSATAVANVVNKLASENIVALLGPTLSATVVAANQTIQRDKIPCLTGATSPQLITLNNPYLFETRASDSITAKVAAKFAVDTLKAKKVGILYNNDEMGTGAKGVIESYMKSANIPYVSEGHNTGDKDMSGQLLKVKDAGVDTLMIWTHDEEFAITARQIKELGMNVKVVGNPGLAMPQELKLMDSSWVEGYYCATDIITTDTTPAIQTFVKAFQAKYNTDPDLYASAYYQSAMVLAKAINTSGSTDSSKICDALRQTKNFDGPEGQYTCDDKGTLLHECVIAQIKNKTPVEVSHVKE